MVNLRQFLRKEYGIIKNDAGVLVDKVKIKATENTFKLNDEREYIVNRKDAEKFEQRGLIIHKTYYFYNLNNPQPLHFNKTTKIWEPIIDAKTFETLIENRIVSALNKPPSNSIFGNITPKQILLGLVVIGVAIYFIKGGSLT